MRILAVEIGATDTVAALLDDDVPPALLTFDARPSMPSGVFLSAGGTFAVGAEGARLGREDPVAHEPFPISRIDVPELRLGDRTAPLRDVLAAILVVVVARARRELDGDWPDEIRLVVPAGWTPARRQVMEAALRRTRYEGPIQLVTVPVGQAEWARSHGPADQFGAAALGALTAGVDRGEGLAPDRAPRAEPGTRTPPAKPPPGPPTVHPTVPGRRRLGLIVVGAVVLAAVVTTVILVAGRRTDAPPIAGQAPGPAPTVGSSAPVGGSGIPSSQSADASIMATTPSSSPAQPADPAPTSSESPTGEAPAPAPEATSTVTTSEAPGATGVPAPTTVGPAGQGTASGTPGAETLPGHAEVGVLLPDQTEPQWAVGARAIASDFQKVGVSVALADAGGSASAMVAQSAAMMAGGVKVLVVAEVDDASGRTIEAQAVQRHITVLDYGTLVPGGRAVAVIAPGDQADGRLMGTALAGCLGTGARRVALLDGPPDDRMAHTLADAGRTQLSAVDGYQIVGETAAATGTSAAGRTAFEPIAKRLSGRLDGVLAGSDDLAGGVIQALAQHRSTAKVVGRGANLAGLRRILAGTQCATVYDSPVRQAAALVDTVVTVLGGNRPSADRTGAGIADPAGGRTVPAVLVPGQVITVANLDPVINDGWVGLGQLCGDGLQAACRAHGVG